MVDLNGNRSRVKNSKAVGSDLKKLDAYVAGPKDYEEILRRKVTLPKTVIAGLAAAALVAGTALVPTNASAAAAAPGHGHRAGNWPQEGTWNWPPTCRWVQVKPYTHKQPYWRWVQRCQ
jgi:hypothetical protein